MMEKRCSAAIPLDMHVLLQELKAHADSLSSKLAVLVERYKSNSSTSNTRLHMENHILREELEWLKQASLRPVEQLASPRDRLAATAPTRCLQEAVLHYAPTPSIDIPSIDMDAPSLSPEALRKALDFDSGDDFKSRMPISLRKTQLARLSGLHVESNVQQSNPSSGDRCPGFSGERAVSPRCSWRENEAEVACPARDPASSVDASKSEADLHLASPMPMQSASNTADSEANQLPRLDAISNHEEIDRNSACVGVTSEKPLAPPAALPEVPNKNQQVTESAFSADLRSGPVEALEKRGSTLESPRCSSLKRESAATSASVGCRMLPSALSKRDSCRALPAERKPEPVHALLSMKATSADQMVSSTAWSTQDIGQEVWSSAQDTSKHRMLPSLGFCSEISGENLGPEVNAIGTQSMEIGSRSTLVRFESKGSLAQSSENDEASPAPSPSHRATALAGMRRGNTIRGGTRDLSRRATQECQKNSQKNSQFPDGDPFEKWAVWRSDSEKFSMQMEPSTHAGAVAQNLSKMQASGAGRSRSSNLGRWERPMACMMVHPRHSIMSFWHVLGSCLIVYDLFMIPIDSFGLPEYLFSIVMVWVITCYWSLDFILQFFLGYENELGQVELRPKAVAWHYLRSWFWMDAFIVTFDWLSFLVFNMGGNSRGSRVRRAWRALRFMRVLRVVKLVGMVDGYLDRVNSEVLLFFAKLLLLTMAVFGVTHYIGCYWYFIGDENFSNTQTTWLTPFAASGDDFYRMYVISLHWSFAQSGFTFTEIYPTNVLEHIYVFFVGFMWLILLATTVSKVTVWLLQLRDANHDIVMQETTIRKYLKDNCVSTDLCEEVVRYCRKFWQSRAKRVHTSDIVIFEDLPMRLRVMVHKQVFMPILTSHPLFEELYKVNQQALVATCHLAMAEHYYPAGNEVFSHDDEAELMFFVLSGELEYFTVKNNFEATTVGVAEWICEAVLWRHWICCGRLVAKSSSELVSIDAMKFHALIEEGEDSGWQVDLLRQYSELAVSHFGRVDPNNDIWSLIDLPELVQESWTKTYGDESPHMDFVKTMSSSATAASMRKHLKQRLIKDK